jgi:hypothetical protein
MAEGFEPTKERVDDREIGLSKEQDADLRDAPCLLRARRERPCRRRGANEANEIAPFDVRHGFIPAPSCRQRFRRRLPSYGPACLSGGLKSLGQS